MATHIKKETLIVDDKKSMPERLVDVFLSDGIEMRSVASGKLSVRANLGMKNQNGADIRPNQLSFYNMGMILKRIY